MGGDIQFFDIIILAMVAGFLILRLRRVLGRRDGHEGGYPDPFRTPEAKDDGKDDNVIHLPENKSAEHPADDGTAGPGDDVKDPTSAGLTQIRVADPSFDPDQFIEGAKVAFEMVLVAFCSGDRKTLRGLLSPDVFQNFDTAITERERAGETLEDTLVGIRSAVIVESGMDGRNAMITVKIVSDQISVVRDASGNVVDGNPNEVIDVTDYWTFARDTRSRDPNWTLIGTENNN